MKKRFLLCLLAMVLLLSSACADELHKLSAPLALGWGPYYEDDQIAMTYPGMIAFQVTDTQYEHDISVTVYAKGARSDVKVFYNEWIYRPGKPTHMSDWDFINNGIDLKSGEYYYVVKALGDGVTTASSDAVTSPVWTYVRPDRQLEPPVNLRWVEDNAYWDAATDPNAGGYTFCFYYSKDNANATSREDVDRLFGWLWYFKADHNEPCVLDCSELMEEPGYYYFTVENVSADMTKAVHSERSALSPAIYWDGTSFVQ